VEEIFQDRKKFAKEVRDVAGVDLGNLGMEICSYTIKDVSDNQGYLESLGKKRTAEVKRCVVFFFFVSLAGGFAEARELVN
jgi:flotillin